MFKYVNKYCGIIMNVKNIIERIGKNRLIHWILLFSIGLFCVGVFEFFYIWFFRYQIEGYLKFCLDYSFKDFIIEFIQVYSVLFVPLLSFIGFKYKNSKKFNSKKVKILMIMLLIAFFYLCMFFYKIYVFYEWIFLFMFIFTLISLKFNNIFALSFSYLSFYSANMLFEFQGLNFLKSFGTLTAYILVFGIFSLTLLKLKIKMDLKIITSFIPIIFLWIYSFQDWQLKNFTVNDIYFARLYTLPFFIVITLKIYVKYNKKGYFTYQKHSNP